MGSRKSGSGRAISVAEWVLPAVIVLVSTIIIVAGETAQQFLRYDRLAIAGGDWWRLVTGHFAHLGSSHFALNMAGLGLIWLLVGDRVSPLAWLVTLIFIVIGIDFGFWLLQPNLLWYVGLSGVLHGLLTAGAMAGISSTTTESVVILGLVSAKITYEQLAGPMPGSESASGGPVVVDAHLYGAVAGLLAGILLWRRVRRDRPI